MESISTEASHPVSPIVHFTFMHHHTYNVLFWTQLGTMLCSMAAVSFADTHYFDFTIDVSGARPNGNAEEGAVQKNDNEQICYVTTTSGNVTKAKEFYVRSRTSVGDHEASQAMQLTSNSYPYKLKYSVRKGVAKEFYNLRGQADYPTNSKGRWNP